MHAPLRSGKVTKIHPHLIWNSVARSGMGCDGPVGTNKQDLPMSEHLQTVAADHERFMQLAREQMIAFEHRETEFRKRERMERAKQLHLPIYADDLRYASPAAVRSQRTVAP